VKPGAVWYRVPALETMARVETGPGRSLLATFTPEASETEYWREAEAALA
jgi:hypothetical protein